MALSSAAAQTGSHNTGSTTKTITPTTTIPAGHVAALCLSYDNAGAAGIDPFVTITDSKGHNWSVNTNGLNNPGINAGVVGRMCSVRVDASTGLTTSDTITVSFGAVSVVAFAWVLYDLTAGSGFYAQENNEAAASQTSATPSITTATLNSVGSLVIGCVAREANGTRTADGDATNGTWSNPGSVGVGTTTSGVEIICETKVVTATTAQTYNPTFGGASADGVNMWVEKFEGLYPTIPPRRPIYPQLLPQ